VTGRVQHVEVQLLAVPFTPGFIGVRVARFLVFLGISLFVLFIFAIVLSVRLRFTASDYSFGIFKLVLKKYLFGR